MDSEQLLNSFAADRSEPAWIVVNDNVMGGRSSGGFELADGRLRFSGALNLRGGGFSSVRTEPWPFHLGDIAGFRLRVRGDGRRYRFRLGPADSRASYMARFQTAPDQWQVVDLPLDAFRPSFRGRALNLPLIDPATIESIGFMIADQQEGSFTLEIDWIEVLVPNAGTSEIPST